MAEPVTPLVGCDVFVLNKENHLLLVKRSDNGFWCLPGGCHDKGETPKQCAERECLEESGLVVECTDLLGVYSSNCYEYKNYPYKNREFTHILFAAKVIGGKETLSYETSEIGWFSRDKIPPLTDGHDVRIRDGWKFFDQKDFKPYFE